MLRCIFFIILSALIAISNLADAGADFTNRADVQSFINKMVSKHQFKRDDLVWLFNRVKYRPMVIKHINAPLEANPWTTYQRLFVNEGRITNGVKFWNQHALDLKKAEDVYGVPASIIVATLGVETKYGEHTGEYRVIDSLTSLGFSNSSRAPFFRQELEEFLMLTREQHLNPLKVTGSYAGAIGMPQFMPSSYRYYAASFHKTNSIDLMNNTSDVIASIANYYKKHGWIKNDPVAVPASINLSRYGKMPKIKNVKNGITVKALEKYGVATHYPANNLQRKAKVIELTSNTNTEYWVGFHNFDVIKRYNPNDLYAMAVYQLSDSIKASREHR